MIFCEFMTSSVNILKSQYKLSFNILREVEQNQQEVLFSGRTTLAIGLETKLYQKLLGRNSREKPQQIVFKIKSTFVIINLCLFHIDKHERLFVSFTLSCPVPRKCWSTFIFVIDTHHVQSKNTWSKGNLYFSKKQTNK